MVLEWLIDAGNSRIKWLPVADGEPRWKDSGGCAHGELESAWPFTGRAERVLLASVASPTGPLAEFFAARSDRLERVTTGDFPGAVAAAYSGLGVDRWLALQAAWWHDLAPCVIADCGSALTLDLLDGSGIHRGGWIAAGLAAARAGLAAVTPGLPGFDPGACGQPARPASDTVAQIAGGLLIQQAAMVERAWRACCLELARPLRLILSGGDAGQVQSMLEVPSRRDDALVLKGLLVISERQ